MPNSVFHEAVSKIDSAKQIQSQRKLDIAAQQTKAQDDFRQNLSGIFSAIQGQVVAFKDELASMNWDSTLSTKWEYVNYDTVVSLTWIATFGVKADKQPQFATGVMDGSVRGHITYRLTSHTLDMNAVVEPTVIFRDPDEIMPMPDPRQVAGLGDAVDQVLSFQTDLLAHVLHHFLER